MPLAIHREDAAMLSLPATMNLEDEQILKIGQLQIKVLHTPGHTPGSICLLIGDHLLDGDTLCLHHVHIALSYTVTFTG